MVSMEKDNFANVKNSHKINETNYKNTFYGSGDQEKKKKFILRPVCTKMKIWVSHLEKKN